MNRRRRVAVVAATHRGFGVWGRLGSLQIPIVLCGGRVEMWLEWGLRSDLRRSVNI